MPGPFDQDETLASELYWYPALSRVPAKDTAGKTASWQGPEPATREKVKRQSDGIFSIETMPGISGQQRLDFSRKKQVCPYIHWQVCPQLLVVVSTMKILGWCCEDQICDILQPGQTVLPRLA